MKVNFFLPPFKKEKILPFGNLIQQDFPAPTKFNHLFPFQNHLYASGPNGISQMKRFLH
jgi:hypothetical protein